jgi:hypothetical protein
MSDTSRRISPETLRGLRGPYKAAASAPGFAALSRFEQWQRVRDQAARTPIAAPELAALDAVDLALKSQLLDWLGRPERTPKPAH